MVEKKIGNLTVKFYEHVDEFPITLYNLVNEYALIDFEIGHTIADVERHFQKLDLLLAKKMIDEAIQARKNMHQAFYNIIHHVNLPALQLACFIHSIDGVLLLDYSMNTLLKTMNELSSAGLTQKEVEGMIEDLKKNFLPNLQ